MSTFPKPNGTVTLPDGRALAYDDIGHPGGVPVIYLHGCPDCRLARPPDDEVDGVRIIAVDRPGYGSSDADPRGDERTQANDIVALADALGIDRFAVFGWSAGGPGALAVGAIAPDRVVTVGVAAGQVPIEADVDLADALDPAILMRSEMMQTMTPDEFAVMVAPLLMPMDASIELVKEAITEGQDGAYLLDLDAVPGLHGRLAWSVMTALRHGLAGAERDMRAMVSPWPFALADVKVPVVLWYGTDDHRFRPKAGRWLADRLPDARLEVLKGASHLLPLIHWQRLIEQLIHEGDIHAPQP